jgi:glycosyltransferase involved in cell wall biosynthesis
MPKLLIVTPYFPPEMGAPQVRLSELGWRLIERGWQVEVLTALPNYPTGTIFPGYPKYRTLRETLAGLPTLRVPVYPSNRGFVRRLASYLSFTASASYFGGRCVRPDVILCESPPLFAGLAGLVLAWRFGCPWVFNISDLWPRSAVEMGVLSARGLPARMAGALEHWLYRKADAVTGQSQEIVDDIAARMPGLITKVITNGVEPARFGPEQADQDARALIGNSAGPVFLFAGLLGLAQGLDQVLDTVRGLPDSVPGRLVLVGDGPMREHLATRIATENIERVKLVPAQPRERVPALLACADVALVSLGRTLRGAVPSKIYEAMATGLPILLVAGGEAAKRVSRAPCGVTVEPGNNEALTAAWTRLATDHTLRRQLGRAGRQEAKSRYSRAAVAADLAMLLESLI